MKSNIFLMFKQGIKGVFKFKIQFSIIVILSFLASLVLTLSISVENRITTDHKKTMNKLGDVDYVWDYKVGSGTSTDSKTSALVPVMDFVNYQFVDIFDDKEDAKVKDVISEYNVNVSSFENIEGFEETFITKSFAKEVFEKEFSKAVKIKNELKLIVDRSYSSADFLASKMRPLYTVFQTEIYENFKVDFFETPKDYVKNTTAYKFINQKNILVNQINRQRINETSDSKMLLDYLDVMISSVLSEVLNWAYKADGFGIADSETYEFIFGLNYNKTTSSNFVVGESEDNNWIWEQKINTNSTTTPNTKRLGSNWKDELMKNGLRGSLSFVGINEETEKGFVINEPTKLKMFEVLNEGEIGRGLSESMFANATLDISNSDLSKYKATSNYGVVYDDYQRQIEKVFVLRQKFIANAFNFDYLARVEQEYRDQILDINFRMVVLNDDWWNKVTLYSGLKPKASNEILVSSGFANANGIKVGQRIDIGGANFVISGIASDALTYYPISNLEIPLPNNKDSAIIYARPKTLKQVATGQYEKLVDTRIFGIYQANKNSVEKEKDFEKLKLSMFAGSTTIRQNHLALNGTMPIDDNFIWSYNIQDIESSVFNWNWRAVPLFMTVYKTVSYTLAAIILAITLITIIIAIKKTIELNTKELGILKAMGESASSLSFGYISYALIVMFITVPLGWIAGSFLQELISTLFLNYSSGPTWFFLFDPVAIGLGMLVFGVATLLVSYFTAYFICKKPTLKIFSLNATKGIKSSKIINWINKRLFVKMNFGFRFSMNLLSSGFKKSLIILATVFTSGLIVSTLISIPATATGVNESFFNYTNYKNEHRTTKPLYNAPNGKMTFSVTPGIDEYDQYLSDANGLFNGKIDNFYKSNTVAGPQLESSLIPHLFLNKSTTKNNKLEGQWTYSRFAENKESETGDDALLSAIVAISANNLGDMGGKVFSIVDFQRVIEWILHEKYNGTAEEAITSKTKQIDRISSLLNTVIPQLMNILIPDGSSSGNGTWKEQVVSVLLGTAPNFIKSYVNKSENRINQFSFGWSNWNVVPSTDTLVTNVSVAPNSGTKNVNLIGIPKDQKAFDLAGEESFLLDDEIYSKLENLLFGDIAVNEDIELKPGFKLFDKETGTLNIPASFNKQSNIVNQAGKIKDISTKIEGWTLENGKSMVPKLAWLYDDNNFQTKYNEYRDEEKFLLKSNLNEKNHYWLPADMLNRSKLTYAPIWEEQDVQELFYESELSKDAFGFNELFQTKDGGWKPRMRPYYSYEDVYLILPQRYEESHLNVANEANFDSSDPNKWSTRMPYEEVPLETSQGWIDSGIDEKELKDKGYIAIKPYSLKYNEKYESPKVNFVDGQLENLTAGFVNWYIALGYSTNPDTMKLDTNTYEYEKMLGTFQKPIKQINIIKTDTVSTYGSESILIDQRLANLISGYNNTFTVPYNYVIDDETTKTELIPGYGLYQYDHFSPNENIDRSIEDQKFQINGIPIEPINRTFNGLLSNVEEPQTITTQVSFGEEVKYGAKTPGANEVWSAMPLDGLDMTPISQIQTLLNTTSIVIASITTILIASVIVVSTLSTILVSDLFVQQYKRFMVIMKSMGYTNFQVTLYTIGPTFVWSVILFCISTVIGNLLLWWAIYLISVYGFAIPYVVIWWSPIAAFILIVGSLILSFWISTIEIRRMSPSRALVVNT
ncbi:ABC transporter permease [Spiroplasma endosymbiont of Othius punctulatus]|uniref:ABC transporter permease n=1 Tax=Spiroplasma endosymbiont of Othius punctulatus TaxID=3066289 RepID=UPI0030D58590